MSSSRRFEHHHDFRFIDIYDNVDNVYYYYYYFHLDDHNHDHNVRTSSAAGLTA